MQTGKQVMKHQRTWAAREKARDEQIARLTGERDDLRIALRKIACDPLTDNPEASPAECLAECERIAWEALGINEPNTEKETG